MSSCTGFGGRDTHAVTLNDGRLNPSPSAGMPYGRIGDQEIYNLASDPPSVDKDKAQWIVPSSYNEYDARSHSAQRERGSFWWLAVDIDSGNPSLEMVRDVFVKVLGPEAAFLLYASRSATEGNRKWRGLIPLAQPIPGGNYTDYADSLFDAMEHFGLEMDRTLARPGQLVYLPNRGEFYQWLAHGTVRFDALGHPHLSARAAEYAKIRQAIREVSGDAKTGPFIGQFCSNTTISESLTKYGFEQKGSSDHWRSPYSTSGGFPFQDRGDHWISLSDSDAAAGLGKPTANGSRYGDAFDLYVHFEMGGDFDKAVASIKASVYGAASSGVLLNVTDPDTGEFFDLFPDPKRRTGNGYDLAQAVFAQQARQREQAQKEREDEKARAAALEEAARAAQSKNWGGDWVKEVPFPLEPSALEWAAWHAPGAIGMGVRGRSNKTSRHSLVPLLAGAVAAVSHMGQGKFVSIHRQHVTPTAVMVFIVGDSGSGKGDSMGTFYDMLSLVDRTRIKAYRTKSFASGQSLTDYLMHKNSDVIMIQQEGGASRKAGKGEANFESLMGGVTEAYTAFAHGIEVTHTKSDEKEAKVVNHPSVASLMASTPKKLFASIDVADSESGWLGRNCFLQVPNTNTNLDAADDPLFPDQLKTILNWIVESVPPMPGHEHPDVWQGNMQAFHAIRFTQEASALSDEMVRQCDRITNDQRRHEVERAVYGRAAEAVNRMATVAGLAKGGLTIDAECMMWAKLVVDQSISYVMSRLETISDEEQGDTPESRVRRKLKEVFRRCAVDKDYGNKLRVPSRIGFNGDVEITKGALKRKLLDLTKVPSRVVNDVIAEYLESGDLVEIPGEDARTKWIRYAF